MRASTSSNDYRYYRDVAQIKDRRECDQPTLPAEEIEDQEDIAHRWEATGKAKQNGLLRKAVAEAHAEGTKLTAARPTLPLYPLVGILGRSGADGSWPLSDEVSILVPDEALTS